MTRSIEYGELFYEAGFVHGGFVEAFGDRYHYELWNLATDQNRSICVAVKDLDDVSIDGYPFPSIEAAIDAMIND